MSCPFKISAGYPIYLYKMAGSDSDSNENDFSFLYVPQEDLEIAKEIELHEENGQDKCTGRKRKRNSDSWKVKHMKRPGLRKNLLLVPITASIKCCKKKCLQNISVTFNKFEREFSNPYV